MDLQLLIAISEQNWDPEDAYLLHHTYAREAQCFPPVRIYTRPLKIDLNSTTFYITSATALGNPILSDAVVKYRGLTFVFDDMDEVNHGGRIIVTQTLISMMISSCIEGFFTTEMSIFLMYLCHQGLQTMIFHFHFFPDDFQFSFLSRTFDVSITVDVRWQWKDYCLQTISSCTSAIKRSTITSPFSSHSSRLLMAYWRYSSLETPKTPHSFNFFASGMM